MGTENESTSLVRSFIRRSKTFSEKTFWGGVLVLRGNSDDCLFARENSPDLSQEAMFSFTQNQKKMIVSSIEKILPT